ncbi:MAG: hypothetical protein Fur0021_40390 [Candidatus Promineifilaceae bacterium]
MKDEALAAAYGGEGWSPRRLTLRQELGALWAPYSVSNEWHPLRAVLLHQPGAEWDNLPDADAAQMLTLPAPAIARAQHQALAAAYAAAGITVHHIQPSQTPPPNLLFAADLFFMTPEGAIVGRPASTVRAGEERWVARRLADLGVPILRAVRGDGVFEGADAMWLDTQTVLLGLGRRTNAAAAAQLAATLAELGVSVIQTQLPPDAMHLMGQLRLVDGDLALAWPHRLSANAVAALRARGYQIAFIPDEMEAAQRGALNVVTLAPRQVLMPTNCPRTQQFYEAHDIACHTTPVSELLKAAGGIACLTGILWRAPP